MEAKIIEGKSIKSIDDFHKNIKQLLNFPDYYGETLDALWDCLNNYIETPVKLIWQEHETSKTNLQGYFDRIVDVFNDAENRIQGFVIEYK